MCGSTTRGALRELSCGHAETQEVRDDRLRHPTGKVELHSTILEDLASTRCRTTAGRRPRTPSFRWRCSRAFAKRSTSKPKPEMYVNAETARRWGVEQDEWG